MAICRARRNGGYELVDEVRVVPSRLLVVALHEIHDVDAVRAKGESLAAEIASAAPLAVGMAKRIIDGLSDIDRGLQLEGWAQSQLFASEDFMEGAQAFMTRRPPQFKGR